MVIKSIVFDGINILSFIIDSGPLLSLTLETTRSLFFVLKQLSMGKQRISKQFQFLLQVDWNL
jgi:hypothetical protein